MKPFWTINPCLIHIYRVFGKQDREDAYPLKLTLYQGRDNKQVNKSIDGVSAIKEVHTVQIRWGEVLLLKG